jgi:hypothetical protein
VRNENKLNWTKFWPGVWQKLTRKRVVKVLLSKEQREILQRIALKLGLSESEVIRMALMDYAKELSVVKDKLHGR